MFYCRSVIGVNTIIIIIIIIIISQNPSLTVGRKNNNNNNSFVYANHCSTLKHCCADKYPSILNYMPQTLMLFSHVHPTVWNPLIRPSINPPIHPPIHPLSIYPFVHSLTPPSVLPSKNPRICPSIHLPIHQPIHLSRYLIYMWWFVKESDKDVLNTMQVYFICEIYIYIFKILVYLKVQPVTCYEGTESK